MNKPGQREDLHARRTQFRQEVGEDGLAVERAGRVLVQLRASGQPDQLLGHRQELTEKRRCPVLSAPYLGLATEKTADLLAIRASNELC